MKLDYYNLNNQQKKKQIILWRNRFPLQATSITEKTPVRTYLHIELIILTVSSYDQQFYLLVYNVKNAYFSFKNPSTHLTEVEWQSLDLAI